MPLVFDVEDEANGAASVDVEGDADFIACATALDMAAMTSELKVTLAFSSLKLFTVASFAGILSAGNWLAPCVTFAGLTFARLLGAERDPEVCLGA